MNALKILFLAANPSDTTRLCLDEEFRQIQTKLRESEYRDYVELRSYWAIRPDDLIGALLQERPHIVHFSGHGSPQNELILLGDDGQPQVVSNGALADLFRVLKDNIRVVLLNACYSKPQAQTITQFIDFTIGMNTAVGDDAAIKFAMGFYLALGYGRTVMESFELGIAALRLARITGDKTPELMCKLGIDPTQTCLIEPDGVRPTPRRREIKPQEKLALEELAKLIASIRQETARFLHEYNEQYFARIDQGEDESTVKAELFSASWNRIDRESDCSKLILNIQLGLQDRNPEEWAAFFREQQRLYKKFQDSVHEAVHTRYELLGELKKVRDEHAKKVSGYTPFQDKA